MPRAKENESQSIHMRLDWWLDSKGELQGNPGYRMEVCADGELTGVRGWPSFLDHKFGRVSRCQSDCSPTIRPNRL